MAHKTKLTPVTIYHYFRLIYRSALFIILLVLYIMQRLNRSPDVIDTLEEYPPLISLIVMIFTVEMILRFFPSKLESPGSQKQFARNYIKSGKTNIAIEDNNGTVLTLLIWIGFNGIFGALYLSNIIDEGIMLLISCAYSVCDIICILFFCPFQTYLLKSKCCATCRIYNWDYAMMFTPLFFVRTSYTWGLLALSVALLIRWEVTFYLHPERFSEQTNAYLSCKNCKEKLCTHKKQLLKLRKRFAQEAEKRKSSLQI